MARGARLGRTDGLLSQLHGVTIALGQSLGALRLKLRMKHCNWAKHPQHVTLRYDRTGQKKWYFGPHSLAIRLIPLSGLYAPIGSRLFHVIFSGHKGGLPHLQIHFGQRVIPPTRQHLQVNCPKSWQDSKVAGGLLAPGELCGNFATNIFFRMEH